MATYDGHTSSHKVGKIWWTFIFFGLFSLYAFSTLHTLILKMYTQHYIIQTKDYTQHYILQTLRTLHTVLWLNDWLFQLRWWSYGLERTSMKLYFCHYAGLSLLCHLTCIYFVCFGFELVQLSVVVKMAGHGMDQLLQFYLMSWLLIGLHHVSFGSGDGQGFMSLKLLLWMWRKLFLVFQFHFLFIMSLSAVVVIFMYNYL